MMHGMYGIMMNVKIFRAVNNTALRSTECKVLRVHPLISAPVFELRSPYTILHKEGHMAHSDFF